MKIQQKLATPSRQLAQAENLEKREIWHKIVCKIILWKEESSKNRDRSLVEKITPGEWKTYHNRIIKANMANGTEKIETRLKKIRAQIRANGGFVV